MLQGFSRMRTAASLTHGLVTFVLYATYVMSTDQDFVEHILHVRRYGVKPCVCKVLLLLEADSYTVTERSS